MCMKCGEKWKRKHKCPNGAIRDHVRQKISNGETMVDILVDLLKVIENNRLDDLNEEKITKNVHKNHFGNLEDFEEALRCEPGGSYDQCDSEFYTNHIHDITRNNSNCMDAHFSDFRMGDDQ